MPKKTKEKAQETEKITVVYRVEGGYADIGLIDAYSGSKGILGFSRLVNLILHPLLNNNVINKSAKNPKNVESYLQAAKKGCYEETLEIHIPAETLDKFGKKSIKNEFWDLFQLCANSILNIDYEPQTKWLKDQTSRQDKNKLDIDELIWRTEESFKNLLDPIDRAGAKEIFIAKNRGIDILKFDKDTKLFTTEEILDDRPEWITGNATRISSTSPYGRFFSDPDGRILPFKLEDMDNVRVKNILIKSLENKVNNEAAKVSLCVRKITSNYGTVKSYLVSDVSKTVKK